MGRRVWGMEPVCEGTLAMGVQVNMLSARAMTRPVHGLAEWGTEEVEVGVE